MDIYIGGGDMITQLFMIRKKLGLTQTEMSKKLHIGYSIYNAVEQGHLKPSKRTIEKLEQGLRIPVKELLKEIIF